MTTVYIDQSLAANGTLDENVVLEEAYNNVDGWVIGSISVQTTNAEGGGTGRISSLTFDAGDTIRWRIIIPFMLPITRPSPALEITTPVRHRHFITTVRSMVAERSGLG